MSKDYEDGDPVKWGWGSGYGHGVVQSRFTEKVTRKIDGAEVTRDGAGDNPAYTSASRAETTCSSSGASSNTTTSAGIHTVIVTSTEPGWGVVFQRSHRQLAGQIAARIRDEFRPELWIESLEAILSHDDNKQSIDDRHDGIELRAQRDLPLVAMSSPDRVEEAKRRITENDRKHRWCSLLMSRPSISSTQLERTQRKR